MSFAEIQFPADISYGSVGGPEYSTDIITTHGGHEQRNSNWSSSRARYDVSYGVKNKEQMEAVIAFFHARKGQAEGFRFKDWTDFEAINQLIGTGDGATVDFQLVKHYISGSSIQTRELKKPIESTLSVYLDSVLQSSAYTLDSETGMLTFDTAPAIGVEVHIDVEFDIPVRFASDQLNTIIDDYGVYRLSNAQLVEIRV